MGSGPACRVSELPGPAVIRAREWLAGRLAGDHLAKAPHGPSPVARSKEWRRPGLAAHPRLLLADDPPRPLTAAVAGMW